MAPVYSPRQTDIKWVEEDHPTLYLTNYKIYIYVRSVTLSPLLTFFSTHSSFFIIYLNMKFVQILFKEQYSAM